MAGTCVSTNTRARRNAGLHCFDNPAESIAAMSASQLDSLQRREHHAMPHPPRARPCASTSDIGEMPEHPVLQRARCHHRPRRAHAPTAPRSQQRNSGLGSVRIQVNPGLLLVRNGDLEQALKWFEESSLWGDEEATEYLALLQECKAPARRICARGARRGGPRYHCMPGQARRKRPCGTRQPGPSRPGRPACGVHEAPHPHHRDPPEEDRERAELRPRPADALDPEQRDARGAPRALHVRDFAA